jgi:hypothetical protein
MLQARFAAVPLSLPPMQSLVTGHAQSAPHPDTPTPHNEYGVYMCVGPVASGEGVARGMRINPFPLLMAMAIFRGGVAALSLPRIVESWWPSSGDQPATPLVPAPTKSLYRSPHPHYSSDPASSRNGRQSASRAHGNLGKELTLFPD